MSPTEPMTGMYRFAMTLCTPIVRGWGRLQVEGLEQLPAHGPVLLAGNHDSWWDPIAVGVGALGRRQVRALAKQELWQVRGLAPVLDGMGQIPIRRGAADERAMERAITELRRGACIGIFPEGTRSRGRELRPRSGLGRLAAAVPEAQVVCVAIAGTTDFLRFPARPRTTLEFFRPSGGGLQPGEGHGEFAARLLAELRSRAPIAAAGRRAPNG